MKKRDEPRSDTDALMELARNKAAERRRAERTAGERRRQDAFEEAQLLRDLDDISVKVDSVWDLITSPPRDNQRLVGVLRSHLKREYSPGLLEGIARALTAIGPQDEETSSALIEAFRHAPDVFTRCAISNALSVSAHVKHVDEIVELLGDSSYTARERLMLVHAVARLRGEASIPLLTSLLEEDVGIAVQAMVALGRLRARGALPSVQRFANHPDSWVRNEVKKALQKLSN